MKRAIFSLVILFLLAFSAGAQTSATITGAALHQGAPLAGVTVTIGSPAMQGTRSAVTDVNGRYAFPAIPPGDYGIRFDSNGMQSLTIILRVGLGQTGRADASMSADARGEETTQRAASPAVLETREVQTNVSANLVSLLPVLRAPAVVTSLAAGTVGGSISGAPNSSSVYLIDGGFIGENESGTPLPLFVEDAIQEITLVNAAIPVEYGRFTGGVVNAITKSGGNDWSGSFRDSFSNPSWTASTPFQEAENANRVNQTFEATLGGRILRDRLWFFVAGRQFTDDNQRFFSRSPSWAFTTTDEELRVLGKLTAQLTAGHSLVASRIDVDRTQRGYCFLACIEPSNIDHDRSLPARLTTMGYSAIVSRTVVVEARWSEKLAAFENGGSDSRDLVTGTWGVDWLTGGFFGAPVFCGVCDREERNSGTYGLKASWYRPAALGTHMIAAGYERWTSERIANNYQSGSNFEIYTFSAQTYDLRPGDVFRPIIAPGDIIEWSPILELDGPSDFQTHAGYIHDRWDLGPHWSLDVGLRYELHDIVDSSQNRVSDASSLSPRLAAVWDAGGDGRYRINASYSRYRDRLYDTVSSAASPGGNPVYIGWEYDGPVIQGLPTFEAFARLFEWFNRQCDGEGRCGTANRAAALYADAFGYNFEIPEALESPAVDEVSVGVAFATGANGFIRLDAIGREWRRFLSQRTNLDTGVTYDPFGFAWDLTILENSDEGFEKHYDGIMLQGGYRIGTRWNLGGNYTWSRSTGNIASTGQWFGSGPDWYPELRAFERNRPVGYLPNDQRHKLRSWLLYGIPLPFGALRFSALQSYDSGGPYSIAGAIDSRWADPAILSGYRNEPIEASYFFSGRGALRWDPVTSTDVGLIYELPLGRTSVFVDLEVTNLFDEDAQIAGDTFVMTARQASCRQAENGSKPGSRCLRFNPFTEAPVEGIHYRMSPTFAQATAPAHYQTPRTWQFSAGVRF